MSLRLVKAACLEPSQTLPYASLPLAAFDLLFIVVFVCFCCSKTVTLSIALS